MIFFKYKHKDLYLVTNLKVMYSTLKAQEDIEEIPKSIKLYGNIILNFLNLNKSEFYLLVRNPYKRLESFFKNKFRAALPNIIAKGEWQYCHEIFFPFIDMHGTPTPEEVVKKISAITFPKFISLLPYTYSKDGHLYPQYWSKHLRIKTLSLGIPIKYKAVFKMESESDLLALSHLFNINRKVNKNSTASSKEIINWTKKEYNTVNELFKRDFNYFGYLRKF